MNYPLARNGIYRTVQGEGDLIGVPMSFVRLNGFRLRDFESRLERADFGCCYVSPCAGVPETVNECMEWLEKYPGWRMTVQAHKLWGIG